MTFPLPDEFTEFVAKYFNLLWKIAESVEQNNSDQCIERIQYLNKINHTLESVFDSEKTSPVKVDYNTLSLAMYLEWFKTQKAHEKC